MNQPQEESSYQKLWIEVKKYLNCEIEYIKLTAIEKLTVILSATAVVMVMIILGTGVLFYLSSALVYFLDQFIGSTAISYLIVSAIYAILLIWFFLMRKKLIITPIARFLSKLFLDPTK